MIIRWLGAFRGTGQSLSDSLVWELSQKERQVAAEIIQKFEGSQIPSKVGLLVKSQAVVRRYFSDVWSEVSEDGRLTKTRRQEDVSSPHREAFCLPDYAAIVIKKGVSKQAIDACMEHKGSLPILLLTKKGKLIPWRAEMA